MGYREYKSLNLPEIEKEVLAFWKKNEIFRKSISQREGSSRFVFYEGPPSANGMPGIHHVMSRTIKDIFCRYKTLKGFQVNRKGGWDTHGLPIELQVEKSLGITKEDIGKKISVAEYNAACRRDVMKFQHVWEDLTEIMGYWVDMDDPYITYNNTYIESLWYLLQQLYRKELLYKGYSIQPYSPAAGTGLSTHELNQPGTYRDVKDTTVVAQFKAITPFSKGSFAYSEPYYFLAWTTTPWTLPSNTALAVGKKIEYIFVKTFNQYTFLPITVVLAKELLGKYFKPENASLALAEYQQGQKEIPYEIIFTCAGSDLVDIKYEQLLPYALPAENPENAFRVIAGDFVTTEDGTGIVHIAPTFGADDARAAKQTGVPAMLVKNDEGKLVPLVDLQGRFRKEMGEFAGKYVKNEYYENPPEKSVDVELAIKLKEENKAFKVEKYEHSYPHCWRTDKPILYYPLDSWFIKTTAVKDRLIELNKTINWKPESTGTGRFGSWLENLQDWNLSRSRYWGTPLPIWRTADGTEEKCIGSIDELHTEILKAKAAGIENTHDVNHADFDLHRPYVDEIMLVSPTGKPMKRETDLVDVWFDSGSMPYAQFHYPFGDHDLTGHFPADFIAEGVDQTRGWFFTLHAISTMLFDSVAFRNVISNGLVLDKNGEKMSKSKGNTVDPFITIGKYGADATRWYMVSNASPWDNLKFDFEGISEVQRKFFGTLYNVYSFFALYANIDNFSYQEEEIELSKRPEIDRWIISLLNSLIIEVEANYDNYEPTKAARAIQDFVNEDLSNWYVRLCRRRFWKGSYSEDKISAYQTLYQCLETVARLMSPVAPMFADNLFRDLDQVTSRSNSESIHLTDFPLATGMFIDKDLESRMKLAQDISSMILSIRKKSEIKVRQPLQKVLIPIFEEVQKEQLEQVKDLILAEVNVKEMEFITDTQGLITKKIKANFRVLGKKIGSRMKAASELINNLSQEDISAFEKAGKFTLQIDGEAILLDLEDVDITSEDIPGWQVASDGLMTVALDINVSPALFAEGLARELVSKIQGLRKDMGLEVTDKITVEIESQSELDAVLNEYNAYICTEILASQLSSKPILTEGQNIEIEHITTKINLKRS